MGNYLSFPILGLAAVLQSTIIPQVGILGGRPDLIFLLVLTWSLNRPLEETVVWAFVGGIMQDLLSAAPTGASVIGLLVMIFAIDAFHRQVYSIGLVPLVWMALIGSFFQQISVMVVLLFTGFRPALIDQLGYTTLLNNVTYVILPTMVYNIVVLLPVYWFVRRIQKRLAGRHVSKG